MSKNNYPIILLDCSGSTQHSINLPKNISEIDSVLKYQIHIAQQMLKSYKFAYVILWNFTGMVLCKTPIFISELAKILPESFGGTVLSKGLEAIPEEWIDGKDKKELYIFTDGEIEDEDYVLSPLKKLIDKGARIQIITVEPNNTNYIQTKSEAGQKLFQVIKNNGLTKFVRRFSSYNEHHIEEPFISFDNPEQIEGYTPFGGNYYNNDEQQDELVDKIEETIKTCETKEELIKVAHEVSRTVYDLTIGKNFEEKIVINSQIADLFAESPIEPNIFSHVNKMLLIEGENQTNGTASTFYDFKDSIVLYSANL